MGGRRISSFRFASIVFSAGKLLSAPGSFIFHSAPSHSYGGDHCSSTPSCFQPDDHFGHLGDFSAPFQVLPAETRERERETFRQNRLSGDTNLFIFSSTKALKTFNLYSLSEDICLSANHCVNARAENESVGQLPNC